MITRHPLILIIMDGMAATEPSSGNAIAQAKTPFLYETWGKYPHGLLQASAEYVGLPLGVKGNSEVGHTNIGAGNIVYQYLPRINKTINKGTFPQNEVIDAFIKQAHQRPQQKIHLLGCLSDGKVHSAMNHLKAMLETLSNAKVPNQVCIHAFTDGRDSPPQSAAQYLGLVDKWIQKYNIGRIVSIIGRQIAMDRNKYWPRIQQAYEMLTMGKGKLYDSWQQALQASYAQGKYDQFIEPAIIKDPRSQQPTLISAKDLVFFMNIRPDRSVELTSALVQKEFRSFVRQTFPVNLYFATMVRYQKDLPVQVAFPPIMVNIPLGRVIAEHGLLQLRIAESQKYPHVTYFANGGRQIVFPGEDRVNIPSRNDLSYDKIPEMSIHQVTAEVLRRIEMNRYDFILLNLANGDMVGHTGILQAGIKAVQYVDRAVEVIVNKIISKGGIAVVTADHGNVDEMINQQTGGMDTEHSIFPVPIMIIKERLRSEYLGVGKLGDIAPTILDLMEIPVPREMLGQSLMKK